MSSRILLCQTTAVLSPAASYTSEVMPVDSFKILSGFVGSNAAGNLYIEYEQTNSPGTFVTVATFPLATAIQFYEFAVGKNARFRYVNGATPQTTFNLSIFAEYL